MKKFLLLLTLLMISAQDGYSQISLGAKAGASASTINYQDIDLDYSHRIGYYVGVYAEKTFIGKVFIRPELLFALKGGKTAGNQLQSESTTNFSYINVPVLVGFKPVARLSVYAGPEVGYLVTANAKTDSETFDLKKLNIYEDFDLGIAAGLLYTLTPEVGIDLRYVHGVNTLIEYSYTDAPGTTAKKDTDGSNRAFQLGISYKLR